METQQTKVCLFVRVSSEEQDYQRQINDLTKYSNKHGYIIGCTIASKVSGASQHRADIQELLKRAKSKEFNKVIVSEISRLGRIAKGIRNTIDTLHEHGISVIFHNLGGIESLDENGEESFIVNIIISIYAELAQEERRILIQRVKSGQATARAKGKHIGRPHGKQSDKEVLKQYSKLVNDLQAGLSLGKCMKVHDLSKNTVLKIKRLIN